MGKCKVDRHTRTFKVYALISSVIGLSVAACSPSDQTDPEARAKAEQAYVECMHERGFEIESIKLTQSDYNVQVTPGDYSRAALAEATLACETLVEPILFGEEPVNDDETAFYDELAHEDLMVEMRDGTSLATTVILPEGKGPFPSLLVRTPYDRRTDFVPVDEYRAAGMAVVVQDVRGRFESEGEHEPFRADGDGELKDGQDTIDWLRAQSWSNGLVAMDGNSASAITTYLAASTGVDGLVAAKLEVGTANLYDSLFPGGVFREKMVVDWLERFGEPEYIDEFHQHPHEDEFWAPLQAADAYSKVNMQALHLGGWYDIFAQGTVDAFRGYQELGGEGARGKQKLIMGPWIHQNLGEESMQGELEYPENSFAAPVSRFSIFAALLSELLELDAPLSLGDPVVTLDDVPAVQYYVMGDVDDPGAPGNEWRSAESWPPESVPVRWYLDAGGVISRECPQGGGSSYSFDPSDPSPTVCGNNLFGAAGSCDQQGVESRDDVLVFSSSVLEEPIEVTGRARALLHVTLDRVDADVMVKLSDVYPDGRSMLVTEGVARIAKRGAKGGLEPVTPGEVVSLDVLLPSTSIILNTGHRLRISIASSNSPKYQVNPGTGDEFGEFGSGPHPNIEVRLHHSSDMPSHVELPMPASQGTESLVCG